MRLPGLLLAWWSATAPALAGQAMVLHRATGPIRIDGVLDEPVWRTLDSLPLVMFRPTPGGAPTESAEIRIGYDAQYLYVGAKLGMRDVRAIRSETVTRDGLGVDDWFRVMLDTYHDRQSGVEFRTNPDGAQYDAALAADGADVNENWNAPWDVATARTANGWSVEMRIPFSSLRFQVDNDRVTMGLLVARFVTVSNELSTFPAVGPQFANADARPSLAATIVLEGVHPTRPVYLTPYLLGGVAATNELSTDGASIQHGHSTTHEVGGDLKSALTPNLNLDLTANTDFAQVEADDQVVNLTRFDISFPDKRQFFQEGAGIFAVDLNGLPGPETFFYSRRIGLTDDGRPLRIYGGARLVGRLGSWEVGALDMQTATATGSGSENVGVWRVRRQLFNDQSTIGAIATTRTGVPGQDNTSVAVDGRIRVLARDFATFGLGQSDDQQTSGSGWDRRYARVGIERTPSLDAEGFTYRAGVQRAGNAFVPGLAFFPRNDYTLWYGEAHYGIGPGAGSIFQVVQPNVVGSRYADIAGGATQSSYAGAFVAFTLRSGSSGWVGVTRNVERLTSLLSLPDNASVPSGTYGYDAMQVQFTPAQRHSLRVQVMAIVGGLYDGRSVDVIVQPSWIVSPHVELSASLERNHVTFATRQQTIDADLANLRLQAAFNTKLSLAAFVQYNRAARLVAGNVRLWYRFSEGRDLYVVLNNLANTDRDRLLPDGPRLPVEQNQTLLIKYAHTLRR